MPFIFADRVKESSTTFGLGDFTLDAAFPSFQTFLVGIGNGNQCYYAIVHDSDGSWEVGIGTVVGATLQRDTVLSSSNAGLPIAFTPGGKTVFVPASAQAFVERLTEPDHALVDHSVGVLGVPGPETFTEADHNDAGFSHAGLPGVPGPETFTEADHNDPGFDHTGLPGIPIISAPAPNTYNVNRVSSTTTVDLTSTTDGIHYISMGSAGADFGVLQVDIPPAPTNATPFLVIFNEDVDSKGAVLAVSNGGATPLVFLSSREGCRLWHLGGLDTEWQVELITPANGHPAESLVIWVGNSNVANDWYITDPNFLNNQASRTASLSDWAVVSPTRFIAMSYQSTNVGVGNTILFIEDEASLVLENPVLTAGTTVESGIPLDFTVTPNVSAIAVDTKSIGLRYSSGGDKNTITIAAYGYSRTGGPVMRFSGDYSITERFFFAGEGGTNADPQLADRHLVSG
jgi:hypothetical protein